VARLEGIFCEPASAAGVAGVRQRAARGRRERSASVVCILTGHGLKDPDTAPGGEIEALDPVAPTADAIRAAIGAA
jgi:threonine synthase